MWALPNSEGERAPFPDVWPAYPQFLIKAFVLWSLQNCKCNPFRFTRRTVGFILLAQERFLLFLQGMDGEVSRYLFLFGVLKRSYRKN
jgi:hypothetical protein